MVSQIFLLVLCSEYKTHWEPSLSLCSIGLIYKKGIICVLKAGKNWAIKLLSPEAILGGNSFTTFFSVSSFVGLFHFLLLEYVLVIYVFEIFTFVSSPFSLDILKIKKCILHSDGVLSSFSFCSHPSSSYNTDIKITDSSSPPLSAKTNFGISACHYIRKYFKSINHKCIGPSHMHDKMPAKMLLI